MKIAVVTPTLKSYGGVAQCAKACIKALEDNGIKPEIITFPIKRFALYNGFFKNIRMLFKQDYDYVFDFTNALTYNKQNYFNYVHFPEYIIEERGKYNKGLWKLYYLPMRLLNPKSRKVIKNSDIDFACNSKFTARRIFETTGQKILVVYPPCDIDTFKNNKEKERSIITVGGFTGEKNQLLQVEIAKHFPDIKTNICGSATRNPKYLKKVNEAIEDKRKHIELHPDIPFDMLKDKLSRSLIFLHTSAKEPFGISTVEAISSGCIPLVHNSGGQIEVVPFRELRFDNKEDAIRKLKKILSLSEYEKKELRKKLQKHIEQFGKKQFVDTLFKFMERVVGREKNE